MLVFPCLRFMWKPIHVQVLGAIHSSHVSLPSPMQIILLSSLQVHLSGWTSIKGMKAMVSLGSPLNAILAWMVRSLSPARQMVVYTYTTTGHQSLSEKSRCMSKHA